MNFEKELEYILRRYVPLGDDKDQYESTIKLLSIKITELFEKCKEENNGN